MTLRDALHARGHLVVLLVASAWLPAVTHAATLSITPASVAANYTGTIGLDITGLTNRQTVRRGEDPLVAIVLDGIVSPSTCIEGCWHFGRSK